MERLSICNLGRIKENMFDPDLESVEFQVLKFTEFLIGRVYFLSAE